MESFDLALKEADGVVNAFELDILKYRGEAEFMLEDYEAAAHTYGIPLRMWTEKNRSICIIKPLPRPWPEIPTRQWRIMQKQPRRRKTGKSSGRSGGGSLFHSGCIQNGR